MITINFWPDSERVKAHECTKDTVTVTFETGPEESTEELTFFGRPDNLRLLFVQALGELDRLDRWVTPLS